MPSLAEAAVSKKERDRYDWTIKTHMRGQVHISMCFYKVECHLQHVHIYTVHVNILLLVHTTAMSVSYPLPPSLPPSLTCCRGMVVRGLCRSSSGSPLANKDGARPDSTSYPLDLLVMAGMRSSNPPLMVYSVTIINYNTVEPL